MVIGIHIAISLLFAFQHEMKYMWSHLYAVTLLTFSVKACQSML